MATSPHDPEILYYGSQHVHRTRDKGVTWEKISPDLTAFDPTAARAPAASRSRATSPARSSTARSTRSPSRRSSAASSGPASNDGPFHVTRDNGKTWTNVTPKDLPTGGRVQWIDASPHRRGSAYFAVYRYLLGDYAPYIYRTDDYGKTLDAADRRQERHPRRLADARRPRRSGSRGPALRRHRVRDVHLVRQRRALAAVPAEHAERADHRHQGPPEGSGRRDAGARVLDPRQPHRAASDHAADDRRRDVRLFKPRDGYRTRVEPRSGRRSSTTCRRRRAAR